MGGGRTENKKRGQLRSTEIRSELPLEHQAVIHCPNERRRFGHQPHAVRGRRCSLTSQWEAQPLESMFL